MTVLAAGALGGARIDGADGEIGKHTNGAYAALAKLVDTSVPCGAKWDRGPSAG